VDQHRNDILPRSWRDTSSRRDVLRGLAGAGGAFGALRLPNAVAAKKKKNKKKRKRQPTCRPGEQVGAVGVPGTGAVVATPVLKKDQRYRLRASGFWSSNATNGQDAFADFTFANHAIHTTVFQNVRLGLSVDDGSPDLWGSYKVDHLYVRELTGQGAALSLRCNDVVHEDNRGVVLVEIFCA
jgi:hypothetical protein